MAGLVGLNRAPSGRFCDGYVWDDDFGTELIDEQIIKA